jgi:methyl-accepting chemotaxis protein
MKTNLPVTQKEVLLGAGQSIVSTTDLKGQITYINRVFLDISGFAESELLGQAHNIVRHPDMPPEAFADLWNTLKAGRPWTGLVKNRCKNGDHYWVVANATPTYQNGAVTGYMSVRTAPTREQIEAADGAYRMFREGRAAGLAIVEGQVVKSGFSLSGWLKNRTIAQRIFGICSLLTAGMLLVGGLGMMAVGDSDSRLQTVYVDRVVPLQQLKEVADAYAVSIVDLSHKTRDGAETFESALGKVEQAQAVIAGRWKDYSSTYLTDNEKKLVGEVVVLMKAGDEATAKLKDILRSKDKDALTVFAAKDLYPAIDPISDKVSELVALQLSEAKFNVEQAAVDAGVFKLKFGLLLAAICLLGAILALGLVRSIRRPIDVAAKFFNLLSEGRSDVQLHFERHDELLAIADSARTMLIKTGFDMSEARRIAAEMTRIKMALDGSGMPMTISNESSTLIYMNDSARTLWLAMEPEMVKRVPGFSVATIFNHSLVDFFDDETVKAAYRAELAAPRTLDINMCGRILQVTATPVRDADGRYMGRASQWIDRTAEVRVENEVAEIVGGAARGDFTQRVAVDGKNGFFLRLANDLNTLMQTSEVGLDDVVTVLSAMADGDLTKGITADYEGTFGQLKDDANQTVARLREIIGQIRDATDAINTAAKEIASGNQDLSSRTEEQASSLEETASSMEQLTSTVKHNADNARQANELAGNAQQVAIRGGEMVAQVVDTMSAIQHSSRRIADIIGVIDGIAFQTNILALNAAVEAARAGEQGRGFAVVATEVRNLAKRSADAAKEIKGLIADSVDKVEAGNRQVDQAGRTMEEIVSSIRQVAKIMGDISEASREQSAGIEQVSLAVTQMDEVTQQNAALVEQAAAAAESLEEQAHNLAKAVSIFKVAAGGKVRQLAAPVAAAPKSAPRLAPAKQAVLQASVDDEWEEF